MLAMATRAARRHGLPLPIPATYRFPDAPEVDENPLAGHGGAPRPRRGLGAARGDRRAGPRRSGGRAPAAPLRPLVAAQQPFRRIARSHMRVAGRFVTGVGGDELLEPSRTCAVRALLARRRPRPGDVRAVAAALAPRAMRIRRATPRSPASLAHDATLRRPMSRLGPASRWSRCGGGGSVTDKWWRSRERLALTASIAAACGHDVTVEHPFTDPEFLGAVAGALWRLAFLPAHAAMDLLFGDALPPAVRRRSDKAAFFARLSISTAGSSSRPGTGPESTRPSWTSVFCGQPGRPIESTRARTRCFSRPGSSRGDANRSSDNRPCRVENARPRR